jgi:glycosyltransferase involved in cell wall biosynthesis
MSAEVSIILTNCNYGQYVARAIRSCLAQTIPVEIVIVDDASTDQSDEMIRPFVPNSVTWFLPSADDIAQMVSMKNDAAAILEVKPGAIQSLIPSSWWLSENARTIKYIQNPKNVGVAESVNIAVRASTSRFFFRLDADDYLADDAAELLLKYIKANKDAFCVSCDYWLFNDSDEEKLERRCAIEHPIACGIVYRRDAFLQYGGYFRGRHREEEELRKRLGDAYKIQHLHIPLLRYRMHDNNKTKEKGYAETKV